MDKLQQVFDEQFSTEIKRLIDEAISKIDIAEMVTTHVESKLSGNDFQNYVTDTVERGIRHVSISDRAIAGLETKGAETLRQHMPRVVQTIKDRVDSVLADTITQKLQNLEWPAGSIDPSFLDYTKLRIKRAHITDWKDPVGIEDIATNVQLTVMNDCVVVEDTLIAKTISADDLIVKTVATDQDWYRNLKTEILDEVPVPVPPKDWSSEIAEVDAKIDVASKRQGQLKELEVTGEALLSDVLYTTPGNRRVGINTMEPSDALTVWDQETEVVIGKHKTQEGYIGTRRRQDINLGSNNKVGLTVRSDGSVIIDKLVLAERSISTSDSVPGTAAKRGDLVFNTKPEQGKFVGWVCLDGIRWAGFGRIE